MRSQLTRAIGERCVVGRDHPAFAGRDDLPRVEAEHGLVRVGADLAALVLGADRRGGVLYDVEAVTLRDLVDRADIAGEADLVDRHDGLRSPRDLALDVRRINVEGAGVDVREHHRRARVQDRVRGRDERERWNDDLVAGTDLDRGEREVQAGRAGGRGDAVLGSDVCGDRFFEIRDPGPLSDPPGLDRVERRARFFLAERRLGDGHDHLLLRFDRHVLSFTPCGRRSRPVPAGARR